MGELLAEIPATVAVAPEAAAFARQLTAAGTVVDSEPFGDDTLVATVTPDAELAAQLQPARTGATQRAMPIVTAHRDPQVEFDSDDVHSSLEVQVDLDAGTQWSLITPASTGDFFRGPWGYEVDHLLPPPGPVDVDIAVRYVGALGAVGDYPVVGRGRAVGSNRGAAPHLLEVTGLGGEACFDRRRVCYNLEAGHGLRHGAIVRALALLAGVPEDRVGVSGDEGVPLNNPLDLLSQPWWDTAHQLAEAAGYWLFFDVDGILRMVPRWSALSLAALEAVDPDWVINEGDIAAAEGVAIDHTSDFPTCVVFVGQAVVVPDDLSGRTLTVTETEVWEDFALPAAYFQQVASGGVGSLVDLAGIGYTVGFLPSKLQIKSRVRRERIEVNGCPEFERVTTWAWVNPIAARYTLDTDGTTYTSLFCFIFDGGASAGDTAEAYAWRVPRFREESRVETTWRYVRNSLFRYGGEGSRGSRSCGVGPGAASDAGTPGLVCALNPGDGTIPDRLERVVANTAAWANPLVAVKNRADTATTWESTDFIQGTRVTGPGVAVLLDHELYHDGAGAGGKGADYGTDDPAVDNGDYRRLAFAAMKVVQHTVDGYFITKTESAEYGLTRQRGSLYLFSDGEAFGEGEERGRFKGKQVITYQGFLSGGRAVLTQNYDQDFRLVGFTDVREDGYLPAVDTCWVGNAARNTAREVKTSVCALDGYACPNVVDIGNPFIEDEDQAAAWGERYLREASAITATVPVPVNGAVRRGALMRLVMPHWGIVRTGWVHAVVHRFTGGSPAFTTLTVKLPLY